MESGLPQCLKTTRLTFCGGRLSWDEPGPSAAKSAGYGLTVSDRPRSAVQANKKALLMRGLLLICSRHQCPGIAAVVIVLDGVAAGSACEVLLMAGLSGFDGTRVCVSPIRTVISAG